jgi:hypothetical protein
MRHNIAASLLVVGLSFASVGHAANITWYLHDVTFNDGGTASGSFEFDADLIDPGYSNIEIITTEGSRLPGQMYSEVHSRSNSGWVEFLQPSYYDNNVEFNFATNLTNSGGSIDIVHFSFESDCAHVSCQSFHETRVITSGYISSVAPVPIPAAAWLFGSGLIGLAGVQRRQKAKA